MSHRGVRERPGRLAHRAGGPVFDLVVSKLRRPVVRRGTVRRWSLIERLARDDLRPIVSVVAPAGYGKTTLLAQWAERYGQAFAWVSVDEADNDPKVLLTYVAEALDAVQPIGGRVFDALGVPGEFGARLGGAAAGGGVRVDDRRRWRWSWMTCTCCTTPSAGPRCRCWPITCRPVRGWRWRGGIEPPLRVARLRAEGRIIEIGAGDLALTREEAALLLRDAGGDAGRR